MTKKILWEDRVSKEHRRMVESGLYDRIPHQEYEPGDIVTTRFSEDTFQVYEVVGEEIIIGYDLDGKELRKAENKNDIRPINGYAQMMVQLLNPQVKITIDRQGHGLIKFPPQNGRRSFEE